MSDPVEQLLEVAHRRARDSLEAARSLAAVHHLDPAFVWSVRSVEIFTKEWLLAPAYMLHEELALMNALKKAGSKFGSSSWARAFAEIERLCGPIDPLLTEDGSDAWHYWEKRVVRQRGDIVHGRPASSATSEETSGAIEYARQLIEQLTLRMLVTERHPAGRKFQAALEHASIAYQRTQATPTPEATEH